MVYEIFLENPIYIVVIALLGAMIFLAKINEKYFASFKLRYALRILRIIVYSLAGGVALNFFLPEHPLLLRIAIAFLVYFLLQTLMYWVLVSNDIVNVLRPTLPLKFKKSVVSWSPKKKHIEIKSALEALGFKQSGVFETIDFLDIEGYVGNVIYLFTFDHEGISTRLFVSFVPVGEALYMVSSAETLMSDDTSIITESDSFLTGLESPSYCDVERLAFDASPLKILKRHFIRLKKANQTVKALEKDILESVNYREKEIIATNIMNGFINPISEWEENGMLTSYGKYRVWLAMIRSSYFPF